MTNTVDTVAVAPAPRGGIDVDAIHAIANTLPGLVTFKNPPKIGLPCFVKFSSPELAAQAIEHFKGSGLTAQFAKNSMR